jgi:hypothetical protein
MNPKHLLSFAGTSLLVGTLAAVLAVHIPNVSAGKPLAGVKNSALDANSMNLPLQAPFPESDLRILSATSSTSSTGQLEPIEQIPDFVGRPKTRKEMMGCKVIGRVKVRNMRWFFLGTDADLRRESYKESYCFASEEDARSHGFKYRKPIKTEPVRKQIFK